MDDAFDFSPYAEDGVRPDEPSNRYRYPIINSPYPRWNYITAVVVNDDLWGGVRPTDDELAIVASFHQEYCDHWYGPAGTGWRGRVMEKRPFDIDGGANGRYLIKYANGGWGFRHRTWTYGPTLVPGPCDEPTSLVAVLDRESGCGDEPSERWQQWKSAHPELFGVIDSAASVAASDTTEGTTQ